MDTFKECMITVSDAIMVIELLLSDSDISLSDDLRNKFHNFEYRLLEYGSEVE